jgi:4-carboxymuconolactone decarboxylase
MKSPLTKTISLLALLVTCCFSAKAQKAPDATQTGSIPFPKGEKIQSANFTGSAWVHMMVNSDTTFNTSIGNVTFEKGAITNWHYHPGGQILLVTSGKGRYQERGKAVRELQKGDIIKCAPNIIHWHGAAPDSELSHVAIGTNLSKGAVVWLESVSDVEYNSNK